MTLNKKLNLLILFIFVFAGIGNAQEKYSYYLDITNVENDQVPVILVTPSLKEKEVTFYMPKIIPGTYSIADYGRFISDLQAFDSKGRELKVTHKDDNSWVIKKANKLRKITYMVDDSFDYEGDGPNIFQPAGTNIEEGKNILINNSGFFGYFDGMKTLPYEVNIIRDKEFYGGTGLIRQSTSNKIPSLVLGDDGANVVTDSEVDTFVANSYDQLVDSPLMYAKPDTVIMKVANTEVLVSAYSPNKVITAEEISKTIKPILEAQSKFLGGKLPVDKYAFVFYFTDKPVTSFGALEHSYSSIYYMPESGLAQMEQTLRDFAAHEFFHIVTPLTIHSEEIHHFDFNNPKMSRHLWLYEGVTEYFAGIVQAQSELVSVETYINMLRQKLVVSATAYNDSLAFTELSLGALGEHENQYANVYQKGALIGLCLDLKLRSLSSGEMGLRDLVLKLSEKYGSCNFFNDPELFDIITSLSYPEIGKFFNEHVKQGNVIPYDEYFALVGLSYTDKKASKRLSFGIGNNNVSVDQEKGLLKIVNDDQLDDFGKALGLKNNDLLTKMNGKDIPPLGPELQGFIGAIVASMQEGKEFSMTVLRKDENGEENELRLAEKTFMIDYFERSIIFPMENATDAQLAIRKAWLTSLSPN